MNFISFFLSIHRAQERHSGWPYPPLGKGLAWLGRPQVAMHSQLPRFQVSIGIIVFTKFELMVVASAELIWTGEQFVAWYDWFDDWND